MKYTIPAIDQRAALALGDIDLIDCHILQWLYYFCNLPSENIERNDYGTWVSFSHLSNEMPLLNIARAGVSQRVKNLATKNYISTYTNKGTRKVYITLLPKIIRLFGDEPTPVNGSQSMRIERTLRQSMSIERPVNEHSLASQSSLTDPIHKDPIHKDPSKIAVEKEAAPAAGTELTKTIRTEGLAAAYRKQQAEKAQSNQTTNVEARQQTENSKMGNDSTQALNASQTSRSEQSRGFSVPNYSDQPRLVLSDALTVGIVRDDMGK